MARRLVTGCGSVVVDELRFLRRFPLRGAKGYVSSERAGVHCGAGGVVLNHLAWSSLLGARCSLLARLGHDPRAELVLEEMRRVRVADSEVDRSSDWETASCLVFVDESCGERSIVMDPGATSTLKREAVTSRWIDALHASSIVTTEVSQLPLSGALAVLETGSENGALGVVDVDVSPETACGREASLGTWDELLNVLTAANVVKMSKQVALDVLSGMRRQTNNGSSTSELCHSLQQALAVDLVLITDGAAGSVGVFDNSSAVHCEPGLVANVRDTTGAGDAFLGGVVAWLSQADELGVPKSNYQLSEMLRWGNACATACVETAGGMPKAMCAGYRKRVLEGCGNMHVCVCSQEQAKAEIE